MAIIPVTVLRIGDGMFCVVCGNLVVGSGKTCSNACRTRLSRMKTTPSRFGFLYTIEFDDVIKFGYSFDPNIRMKSISAASGRVGGVLTVHGPYRDALSIERKIHGYIAEMRVSGEWYALHAKTNIESLISNEDPMCAFEFDLMNEREVIDDKISKIRSFIFKDCIDKFIDTIHSNPNRGRLSHSDMYNVINDVSTCDYLRVVKGAPAFFFESVTDIESGRSGEIAALHSIDTSMYSAVVFSCCVCKDLMNTEQKDVVIDILVHICGRKDLAEWVWFICNE